jgi:hypothetical protein
VRDRDTLMRNMRGIDIVLHSAALAARCHSDQHSRRTERDRCCGSRTRGACSLHIFG